MKYNPYSVSKIGAFKKCPMSFKLNYIDGIRRYNASKATVRGSYLHDLLEHYPDIDKAKISPVIEYNHLNPNDTVDIHECIKVYEKFTLSTVFKNLPQLVRELDFSIPSLIDLDVSGDFYNNDAVLRGSADGFNDEHRLIIDYKSGKDNSLNKTFGLLQAQVYALAMFASDQDNLEPVTVRFLFIEHNTSLEHVIEFEGLINAIARELKPIETATEFNCKVTALCDWCVYKDKECTKEMRDSSESSSLENDLSQATSWYKK